MVSFYLSARPTHGLGESRLDLLLKLHHRAVRQIVRDPVLGDVCRVQFVVFAPPGADRLDVWDHSMKQIKVLDGSSTLDGCVVNAIIV